MDANKRLKQTIPSLAEICKHQVVQHVPAEKWAQLPPGLLQPILGQHATMDALQRRIEQDPSQVQAVMALYAHCALLADAYKFVHRPVMLARDHARFHQMHGVLAASMAACLQFHETTYKYKSTWNIGFTFSVNCMRFISAATRLRAARGYMWTLAELRANVLASRAVVFLDIPKIIINLEYGIMDEYCDTACGVPNWMESGWMECVGSRSEYWHTGFAHLSVSPMYLHLDVVSHMNELDDVVKRLDSLQATNTFVFYNPPPMDMPERTVLNEHSSEHSSDHSSEHSSDHSSEHSSEHGSDHGSDHSK